ncbi:hypothetical protein ENBRE01_2154 [Enteropsectra breve]|nr:hypothetical protein ENBRE01_2154 [Enteropsectra breve]
MTRNLSDFIKGQIVLLYQARNSGRKVSKLLNLPKSTVADFIKKYNKTQLIGRKKVRGGVQF